MEEESYRSNLFCERQREEIILSSNVQSCGKLRTCHFTTALQKDIILANLCVDFNSIFIVLQTKSLEWEQELYNHFKYNLARPYFHAFAADVSRSNLEFHLSNLLCFQCYNFSIIPIITLLSICGQLNKINWD